MSEITQLANYSLELARPQMLWTLVFVIPIAWYFLHSLSDFPVRQRRLSLAVRTAIVLLLALALGGLALISQTSRMMVVLVVDQSLSVDEEASKSISDFVDQAEKSAGDNHLTLLDFAAEPG